MFKEGGRKHSTSQTQKVMMVQKTKSKCNFFLQGMESLDIVQNLTPNFSLCLNIQTAESLIDGDEHC